MKIIIAYPFVILIVAIVLNVFVIGVNPYIVAMLFVVCTAQLKYLQYIYPRVEEI